MLQDCLLNCEMLGLHVVFACCSVNDAHFLVARILNLLGYEPMELLGKTAYQFHNPADAEKIKTCHSSREYNAVQTHRRRFLIHTRHKFLFASFNIPNLH